MPSNDTPACELCGEPMPPGEEMFKYHGFSGPCPKPAKPEPATLQHGMNCAGLIPGQEDECTCGLRWRIQLATEQEMHAAWRKRAEEAETREGALQIRIENAVAELNSLADLLADSEDLPVQQTPAVRLVNEILEALSGLPRNE